MTDIPVIVATNIVQRLVDRAIDEIRYLCCFSNIAEDYENEKKKLMTKQKSVEDDVREAEDQNEEIVIDVKDWQSKANNMIWEDTKEKKSCFFGLLPNCIWFYRRGKDLERMAQEIKKLIESSNFDKFSRPIKAPGVEYYSSEDFIRFKSRNSAQEQLHEALKNDDNYMIGLHGFGGSGKTKLVIQVGNEVKKSKLFDKVIFVVVSNPPNVRKIQDDIASQLDLKEDGNESERPKKLWSRLRNGQKILIILDDVWEKLNFENIGIPTRNNHEGCRVLLTTRDLDVCKSMECQTTIRLDLLPDTDAWILFQRFAEISDKSSQTLKDVAQKITSECKGFPVAITTMASTLKGQPLEDWKGALTTLQRSIPMDNIHEDLKHVYKCLRVSYDNLKSDKAKDLFLLCSMFPEDHEIPNEELIRYAIAIGLFGELKSYQTTRTNVNLTKTKLTDTCLLLKTEDERCVKMHDLVREVAHETANNEIHETMEPKRTLKALHGDTAVKQNKIRYLYCHNMNDFSYPLDLPNLEILILVCNNEYGASVSVPVAFFDGMKGIKVLTLKGEDRWHKSSIQLMPISIEVLNNLRTLDLRDCILGDISVLGNLQRIETLELIYCSINELPNGILELKKLRLFRLESCKIKENPYNVIGGFSEIEELYFMDNDISNGEVDNEVVADLFNKSRISSALQRYHIEISVRHDMLAKHLNDSISRALAIEHFDASTSNVIIKDLIQRAEILCLDKLEVGCKSISPDFVKAIGGAMSELIKLGLYDCLEIECLIDTTRLSSSLGTVFSNLTGLAVSKMDNLKELCHGSTPFDILEKLEDLTIRECGRLQNSGLFVGNLNLKGLQKLRVDSCPKLTYLFPVFIAQSLVSLEDITIESCDAMKCIIKDETKEIVHIDHDQRTTLDSMFPKLTTIKVSSCEQLELFSSAALNKRQMSDSTTSSTDLDKINCPQLQNCGFFVGNLNLSAIKVLLVESCPQLAYLFTVSIAQSLVVLEYLTIKSCDAMECIIKEDSKEVVDRDHDQRSTLVSIFPKLRGIKIRDCGKFECFLSEKVEALMSAASSINMGLEVSNLDFDIKFPALEELTLAHLPNMISICTKKYHANCPSLKKFYFEDCPHFAIIEFIEHSNARQLECNDIESEEFLKQYRQKLQAEEQKFSQNASPNGAEDLVHEQSISQPNSMGQQQEDSIEETVKQNVNKIPDYEEIPASSLVNSEPRNSQSTKESFQEDLASTKVKIGTPSCPSSELGNSMPHLVLASLPKTSSKELVHEQSMNQHVSTNQQQALGETKIIKKISITDMPHDDNITDTEKQSIQEDVVSEKTKMPTSSTNYGPTILPPVSLVIPIQNSLSQELMEHEEVDFHGLFKIDSRRASLLDNAFAKYPHLWDWQKIIPPKFCKLGYESLSNMLVFLKKKTPKAMDESSKEEFEKLYAELEFCRFDKGWLASIHQRVNDRLKHLVELESQLDHVRAEIARIKDDLSKYEIVFDF